jgi:hypothetical protein
MTMSATIDRNQPVTVTLTLTAEHWDMIGRVLGKGPYEVVAPLLVTIHQECMRYAAPVPEQIQRSNGEDQPSV